jgi:hypothetical protein
MDYIDSLFGNSFTGLNFWLIDTYGEIFDEIDTD